MNILLEALGPLIYILSITGTYFYLFKKKYSFTTIMPLALMGTTILVFILNFIFHNLSICFWLTVLLGVMFVPLLLNDKNRSYIIKKQILTPSLFIFLLLYFFLLILDWYKIIPLFSDSSMHWGPHVWTMWLRNDFYTSPNISIVIHGDYPPMIQLFELLWVKAASIFNEGLLMLAIQILSFSMIMPVFGKLDWTKSKLRDALMIVLFTTLIIIIPMLFFVSNFYSNLELDTALAFIFAYGIYLAKTESKKLSLMGIFKLSIVITFIIMVKQIAILLAGVVLIIYFLCLWLSYRKKTSAKKIFANSRKYLKAWRKNWKGIAIIVVSMLLPVVCMYLWNSQIKNYSSPDPAVAIFHLKPTDTLNIPDILRDQSGSEAQQYFARAYIKHIFVDPGGFLLNFLGSVSYAQIVILFAGGMMFIAISAKNKQSRNRIGLITFALIAGWFLYSFAIYAVFLFGGMNDIELSNIDTPNRYLRTYLFALLLTLFMFCIARVINNYQNSNYKPTHYLIAVMFIIFGILFNQSTFDTLGLKSITTSKDELRSLIIPTTVKDIGSIPQIEYVTFSDPAKILVTASTDNVRHYIQYKALPDRITLLLFEKQTSQDLVCKKIQSSDYLIISYEYPDASSWESIAKCTNDNNTPTTKGVYKLLRSNGAVTIQAIQPKH